MCVCASSVWTNLLGLFREYEDLTTGQMMLQDLVEREGIPVFESVPIALNCTAKVSRRGIMVSICEYMNVLSRFEYEAS
jgi:hypothetical protein